jgi:hypothetical protein
VRRADVRSGGARRAAGRPTDAAPAPSGLDAWLAAGPWPQRWAMRALRALAARPRGAALLARLGPLGQLGGSIVALGHYDEAARGRALGWDAAAVVARGRALRRAEGRP